ncbi:hypothetical protein FNF27_02950 [Cafeteria roenbergensis]|uniref:PAC1-like LisH-like dimerisation domain-containing protein n=1 Tax=Cafeteria roenbergensis TaxID=33653 RepID=A0A5A8EI05_CAFRO|nr:hypothetical protein FNF27_02950 [Cafeteria roenbergensis]
MAAAAGLSDRHKDELHKAVVEYLESFGGTFADSAAAMRREAGIGSANCKGEGPRANLLARKWTVIARLQKQVTELEARLAEGGAGAGLARPTRKDFLPMRAPQHTLSGHRGAVLGLAFHPAHTLLATCGEDASVRVWDAETGTLVRSLRGHTAAVSAVAFDGSGDTLVSASHDASVRLWDARPAGSFTCRRTLTGHEHTVSGVAVFASRAASLDPSSAVQCVASASRDGTIRLWDLASGASKGVLHGHDGWVRRVAAPALAPGEAATPAALEVADVIVSCGADKTVRVWDTTSLTEAACLRGHSNVIESVALCGPQAAAAMRRSLASAAAASAAATGTASAPGAPGAAGAGFAGLYAVSGDRDCNVIVWDLGSRSALAELKGHTSWVRGVAFHPCGSLVLSVAEDHTLRVWDVARQSARHVVERCHEDFVTGLAAHPGMALMATAGLEGTARVWQCA